MTVYAAILQQENPETNTHKEYHLYFDENTNELYSWWGRIGSAGQARVQPDSGKLFYDKRDEKIRKGYELARVFTLPDVPKVVMERAGRFTTTEEPTFTATAAKADDLVQEILEKGLSSQVGRRLVDLQGERARVATYLDALDARLEIIQVLMGART